MRNVLLLLALILTIASIAWLFQRRGAGRRRDSQDATPPALPNAKAAPTAPRALPAAQPGIVAPRLGPLHEAADGAQSAAQFTAMLTSLQLGVPALGSEVPAAHARLVNEVLASLQDANREPKFMPRRPLLMPELMRAVNDADSSRRQIAALVTKDPALAADLLRVANSALYRTGAPIESIDRAVAVLGTNGLRSLIAAALMQPVFAAPSGAFARFPALVWDHAFISGLAAETCAAIVENEDPFAAQLLALLNGLGAIVVFRVAMDRYASQTELQPDATAIARLLDLQAAAVARRIAASWDVSERMLTGIGDQVAAARGSTDQLAPLGRAVLLGRRLGTLALLEREGQIDSESAKTAAVTQGAPRQLIDRLWQRLTAR